MRPAGVLAAGAGALPTAKRLETRPCASGGALRAVGVRYASLNIIEEPVGLFWSAVEPGCKAVFDVVGAHHSLIQVLDFGDGGDGHEHLLLPELVLGGQVNGNGRGAEVTLAVHAVQEHLAARQDAAVLVQVLGELLVIAV